MPLPPSSYTSPRISPSGDTLSLWISGARCDIEIYDIPSGRTTKLTSENDNYVPVWAPDGQRLAYISSKRGSPGYELVSRPVNGIGPVRGVRAARFPGRAQKHTISIAGGSEPVWDRRGRELFFRNGDQMMVVAVNPHWFEELKRLVPTK